MAVGQLLINVDFSGGLAGQTCITLQGWRLAQESAQLNEHWILSTGLKDS